MRVQVWFNAYTQETITVRCGQNVKFLNNRCSMFIILRKPRGKHWHVVGEIVT